MSQLPAQSSSLIDTTAAQWLARRDRALTASEQDAYLQWLREDPRHAAAMARQEATLGRMMQLAEWQPALRDEPNPDLFAPPRRHRRWPAWTLATCTLAAAAVVAVMLWPAQPVSEATAPVPRAEKSYLRVNERQALADGSIVELKDGSRIQVDYSAAFRRVHLSGGEAHFTVAKDSARPFIVEAAGMEVQAVGTVFNVRLDAAAVEVLVTEGKVKLATPAADAAQPAPLLAAGERAIFSRATPDAAVQVAAVTPEEIREALAWQTPRLQFYETPLGEAVMEFNRHTQHSGAPKLVLGHPALAGRRIGGTYRVDDVEGFVRLLEITLQLQSERQGNGDIVLHAAR